MGPALCGGPHAHLAGDSWSQSGGFGGKWRGYIPSTSRYPLHLCEARFPGHVQQKLPFPDTHLATPQLRYGCAMTNSPLISAAELASLLESFDALTPSSPDHDTTADSSDHSAPDRSSSAPGLHRSPEPLGAPLTADEAEHRIIRDSTTRPLALNKSKQTSTRDPASRPLIPNGSGHTIARDVAEQVLILDVRYPGPGSPIDGHLQYLEGHIPSACYISMDEALAAPHILGVTGRHPLPSHDVFEEAMRAAGLRKGRPVVIYDDWKSIAAARCWWLLRNAGHENVRVLDGGWRAWVDAALPVETGEVAPIPGSFTAATGFFPSVDAVGVARIASEGILLDARPANRFRGEDETIDPVAGHIPGARSFPALNLINEDGYFLPAHKLRTMFASVGATDEAEVGVYCGSGIQASHAVLAAAVAGLRLPALYAGSWSEWIVDPSREVEIGV